MVWFKVIFSILKQNIKRLALIMVFLPNSLYFQPANAVETLFWVDTQTGVAIGGYDPISFFLSEGRMGNRNYEYFWAGAIWRFENEGNLAAFRDAPLVYMPQFGGFDASKMYANIKVSPDPIYSDLFENRLYLFHSEVSLAIWQKSQKKYLKGAQSNWLAQNSIDVSKNFIVRKIKKDDAIDVEMIDAIKNSDPKSEYETKTDSAIQPGQEGDAPSMDSATRMGVAAQHFKDKLGK